MLRAIGMIGFSLCIGVGSATASNFNAPASDIDNPKQLWRDVMAHFYGPYDAGKKCWIAKEGGDDYCMRPHVLKTVSDGGDVRLFLAIGGQAADADAATGCHACSGNLGLIILEKRDGHLELLARNGLFDTTGSWGQVPPEENFAVERIGPAAYGWVIESGYTAQGVTGGGKEIFSIVDDKVVSLGSIPTYLDNCGAQEDPKAPCDSYAFDLKFGPGGSGSFYDAEAAVNAESGKPPGASQYAIPFNTKTNKYETPKELDDLLAM